MGNVNSIPVVECPQLIRSYCDGFKDRLEANNGYRCFVALVCASVFGEANLSMIVRYFLFSPSVSALSRFLNTEDLAPNLNRRHRLRLKAIFLKVDKDPRRYQYALDDTFIPHSGKNIWGVYTWYDHTKKCCVKAHKLLVLGLVDQKRKLFIPIIWEILHRDLSKLTDAPTNEDLTHEKAWEIGLRFLDAVDEFGLPKLTVAADSWFFGNDFCDGIVSRGFNYVIEVRSNLKVRKHGKKSIDTPLSKFFMAKERRVIRWQKKSKFVAESVVTLSEIPSSIKVVAVANHREIDEEVFGYYACNQLTWDASKIWGYSRGRWSIEVQFRELKQLFALGGAAVRSKQSVETEVSISMIALTVIRLEQLADADSNKNQYAQPNSAGNIVRKLEINSVSQSILKLAMQPKPSVVSKFRLRYTRENLNSKPAERSRKKEIPTDKGKLAKSA